MEFEKIKSVAMSESSIRKALGTGGLLLVGIGITELWCARCAGMPLTWPVWWAALFLFGVVYACFCLLFSKPIN